MQLSSTCQLVLTNLNAHLTCPLCKGYLIDATTIIECLHSFCRTCIHHYLETNKFCPVCDVQVHKTKPHVNLRPDKTMQTLVYKIVPGLYKNEMKRRKEFYHQRKMTDDGERHMLIGSPEEKNQFTAEFRSTAAPLDKDHQISLCLKMSDRLPPLLAKTSIAPFLIRNVRRDRRYLLCPAGVTVGHLKHFVRCKLDVPTYMNIDMYHSDEMLKEFYTLQDIANIYTWRQTSPLKLYYVIYCNPELESSTPPLWSISNRKPSSEIPHQSHMDLGFIQLSNSGEASYFGSDTVIISDDDDLTNTVSCDNIESSATDSKTVVSFSNRCTSLDTSAGLGTSYSSAVMETSYSVMYVEAPLLLYAGENESETGDTHVSPEQIENQFASNENRILTCIKNINYCHQDVVASDFNSSTSMHHISSENVAAIPSAPILPLSVDTQLSSGDGVNSFNTSAGKVGFEPDALSGNSGFQTDCVLVVRRNQPKSRRLIGEVRSLFIDENKPCYKRELRKSCRAKSSDIPKTGGASKTGLRHKLLPFRPRSVVRPSVNRNARVLRSVVKRIVENHKRR